MQAIHPTSHTRRVLPGLALFAAGLTPGFIALPSNALPLGTGFESVAAGSSASPTAVVSSDGIVLQLNPFVVPGGGFTFNFAEVQLHGYIPPASGFGDGENELELNDVFAAFDFGGAVPNQVSFGYAFLGGATNLQVNGPIDAVNGGLSSILGVALTPAVQTFNDTYNGFDFELTGQLLGGNNEIGRLTLGDGVDSIGAFGVGGQELAIDSIRAVPEPAETAALSLIGLAVLRRRRS